MERKPILSEQDRYSKIDDRESKIAELEADGFVPMKEWRSEEAKRVGVCDIAIAMRLTRGHYGNLERYAFNKRVIYVR